MCCFGRLSLRLQRLVLSLVSSFCVIMFFFNVGFFFGWLWRQLSWYFIISFLMGLSHEVLLLEALVYDAMWLRCDVIRDLVGTYYLIFGASDLFMRLVRIFYDNLFDDGWFQYVCVIRGSGFQVGVGAQSGY